jgi:hypothetical protein
MTFLEQLKQNNEFPIIFIGSGITQRYSNDAFTWEKLLVKIWTELESEESFYTEKYKLGKITEDEFECYTKLASEMEQQYNDQFYENKISINGLSLKQANQNNISPFKYRIAQLFSNIETKEEERNELKKFCTMLKKAKMIVTTNYDDLIERQFNQNITVHIGNTGLFEPSINLNELFKIHGSISDPKSIVITSEDYNKLERTSAIVNAKILSQLTVSPIIFLGYSLKDRSIQSLLKDLSENMPFPLEAASKRIGVVRYEQNKQDIDEVLKETSFGVHYTEISTDNYAKIYDAISEIDQGFSPAELARYEGAFRKIIEVKGRNGELNKVLTTFIDLNNLPGQLKNKNMVVAFGDKSYIYKYPEYSDYIKSYFLKKANNLPLKIAISFIVKTPLSSALPIAKYIKQLKNSGEELDTKTKEKITKRLKKFQNIGSLKLKISQKIMDELKEYDFSQYKNVLSDSDGIKSISKITYFSKNIEKYGQKVALDLIKYILENEQDDRISETAFRKLFMAYSLVFEINE